MKSQRQRKPGKTLKRSNPREWKARALRASFLRLGLPEFTKERIRDLLGLYGGCGYCGDPDILAISIDHKTPLARGGKNAPENVHFVCLPCNRMKGALTHEEFCDLLKFLEGQSEEMGRIVKTKLKMAGYGFAR